MNIKCALFTWESVDTYSKCSVLEWCFYYHIMYANSFLNQVFPELLVYVYPTYGDTYLPTLYTAKSINCGIVPLTYISNKLCDCR